MEERLASARSSSIFLREDGSMRENVLEKNMAISFAAAAGLSIVHHISIYPIVRSRDRFSGL